MEIKSTYLKIILYLHILFLSSLSSCVREEAVPYNSKGESKIVIIGFLTPDENIEIYVGRSQPFGKKDYQPSDFIEPDALVTIADESGNNKVLTLNSTNPSIYSCSKFDFSIVAGKNYKIVVKGRTREVYASTTVPLDGAIWETAKLIGPIEYSYYNFDGSWKDSSNSSEIGYGVSIKLNGKSISSKTNEGINKLDNLYTIKREVYLANSQSIEAILLTKDKAFLDFSLKTDLTEEVIENLKTSAFADIISGFKGVIPNAGNINGGIGVFGSYLKSSRILNK